MTKNKGKRGNLTRKFSTQIQSDNVRNIEEYLLKSVILNNLLVQVCLNNKLRENSHMLFA